MKRGDFNKLLRKEHPDQVLKNEVKYVNTDANAKLDTFEIYGYDVDYRMAIYFGKNRDAYSKFSQLYTEAKLNRYLDDDFVLMDIIKKYKINFKNLDKNNFKLIKKIFEIIHNFDALDDQTKNELETTFHFLFSDNVMRLAKDGNINAAIDLANKADDPEMIWKLC